MADNAAVASSSASYVAGSNQDATSTRRGPLTTISGFIPSYTHLHPWLNRVWWGYNYLITRGGPFLYKGNPSDQSLSFPSTFVFVFCVGFLEIKKRTKKASGFFCIFCFRRCSSLSFPKKTMVEYWFCSFHWWMDLPITRVNSNGSSPKENRSPRDPETSGNGRMVHPTLVPPVLGRCTIDIAMIHLDCFVRVWHSIDSSGILLCFAVGCLNSFYIDNVLSYAYFDDPPRSLLVSVYLHIFTYEGFLKCPTKNVHFGVFWGYH